MCETHMTYEVDEDGYVRYFNVTKAPDTGCIFCKVKVGILKLFGKDKTLCRIEKIAKKK